VQVAEPEHNGWEVFHQLLRGAELPARLCSDAYLAALAIANGWRLVSFDRDFERFDAQLPLIRGQLKLNLDLLF
jgi:predicted nucleic acid-binding protein